MECDWESKFICFPYSSSKPILKFLGVALSHPFKWILNQSLWMFCHPFAPKCNLSSGLNRSKPREERELWISIELRSVTWPLFGTREIDYSIWLLWLPPSLSHPYWLNRTLLNSFSLSHLGPSDSPLLFSFLNILFILKKNLFIWLPGS